MESPILIALASLVVSSLLGAVIVWKCYRRVGPGEALILEGGQASPRVSFVSVLVIPGLHRAQALDTSVRKVVVERRGRQGLSCQDCIRVDLRATFLVKVERTVEDVLQVAKEVGCERANRPEEVQALLEERFACALANAASTFNFDELVADRSLFIDHVMMEVGNELLGFKLERMSLGRLEQTPLDQLDPTNVMDATGILRLTERATRLAMDAGSASKPAVPREPDEGLVSEEELVREMERAASEPTRKH